MCGYGSVWTFCTIHIAFIKIERHSNPWRYFSVRMSFLDSFPMLEQRCQFTAPDGTYEICWDPESFRVFVHNNEKIVFTSEDSTIQSLVKKLYPTCTITNVKCPNNVAFRIWNDVYTRYTTGYILNKDRVPLFQSMKKEILMKSLVSSCDLFGFDLVELE